MHTYIFFNHNYNCNSTCNVLHVINKILKIGTNGTAFGQFEWNGCVTIVAETCTTITWKKMSQSNNILYNNASGAILFPFAGAYQVSISFAEHDTVSQWAGFRVWGVSNGVQAGISSNGVDVRILI